MQHLVVRTSRSEGLENDANNANDRFTQNAAGFNVSHVFGYGLLDAYGLVSAAPTWKTVPEKHLCTIESVPLIERSYRQPGNNCNRRTSYKLSCQNGVSRIRYFFLIFFLKVLKFSKKKH